MWNDSKNDTIPGYRFAITLSFCIGCIWVQKLVLGCKKGSVGATPSFRFCQHFGIDLNENPVSTLLDLLGVIVDLSIVAGLLLLVLGRNTGIGCNTLFDYWCQRCLHLGGK